MSDAPGVINKGVDLTIFKSCAKQRELGPKRFAMHLKKIGRAAKAAPDTPARQSAAAGLSPERRKQLALYQEIHADAAVFAQGTPECAACNVSGGKPFGCYYNVSYPIDSVAERALFEFFTSQIGTDGTTCEGLYRDIVSKIPPSGTAWHKSRGPTGDLAEADDVFKKEWGFLMWKKRVDSAQILASLFFSQRRLGVIAAFHKLWSEFSQHAQANVASSGGSPTMLELLGLEDFYERLVSACAADEGIYLVVEDDAPPTQPKEASG